MNLIYMCVFYKESYITLLKLLITSISLKGNIDKNTTDILIITSQSFQPIIQQALSSFYLPIHYYILDLKTLMDASCCKLKIFNYEQIDKYDKILYLDTDVLVNSDLNMLFNIDISSELLYALEEGTIGHEYWGSEFFDFNIFNMNTSAYSAGVFYFMNSESIKNLFEVTNQHISDYMSTNLPVPKCLDQPFLVYNSFIQKKYDNKMMITYVENNPTTLQRQRIIYHFPGGPGNYDGKYPKMCNFLNKINTSVYNDTIADTILQDKNSMSSLKIFDTRNEMLKYYCDEFTQPSLLEIGVFKGDFLDYLVRSCNIGSIDAVDLFQGDTCSGDVDGNNVVYYNVGKSYTELCEKYKDIAKVHLYKSDSSSYLDKQADNTYDIIYIDGDHSYNGVKNDLASSYKKIKNGGYIMGHDYEMNMAKAKNSYNFGVKQAVDEFCGAYGQLIIAKALDGCVSYCVKVSK
jgi:lipopolysaccharide biosynthesis glycosyltransferase